MNMCGSNDGPVAPRVGDAVVIKASPAMRTFSFSNRKQVCPCVTAIPTTSAGDSAHIGGRRPRHVEPRRLLLARTMPAEYWVNATKCPAQPNTVMTKPMSHTGV